MLSEYLEQQPLVCDVLKKEIKNGKIIHADLFDENNNPEALKIVQAFIKEIIVNNDKKIDINILSNRIESGNYPELRIIEPDGMIIRKQQILELQNDFSMSSIEGNMRFYIIRDADKMRVETANTMLKFLEEPSTDVVAILMTNNINNILSTIVSRCQIIRLFSSDSFVNDDAELSNMAYELIKNINLKGNKTILDLDSILFDKINVKDREKLTILFDRMIDMYYDMVKLCLGEKDIKNKEYYDELDKIAKKYNQEELIIKLNYLLEAKESIKYNVNTLAIIDSMIINVGGSYESCWS